MTGPSAARRCGGIDLGGTKALGVVLDSNGLVEVETRLPTPRGTEQVLSTLADLADQLGPLDALGIGAAGLVNRAGVLRSAPNLRVERELPIGPVLAERLAIPVAVANDATCATAAEWRLGAGQGHDDVQLVTLGTGIGGGAVVSGRLQRGVNGFAGEPGHMVVDPDGPPCVCGKRGCWERYASGSGLARLAREAAVGGRLSRVVALAGGDPELVRGEHVQMAAREGDADATAVMDAFAWWVALGLVNLTNIADPSLLVLGGGLVAAADLLLGPVRRHYGELLYAAEHRTHPAIVPAGLGERAGAIGAALLAAEA